MRTRWAFALLPVVAGCALANQGGTSGTEASASPTPTETPGVTGPGLTLPSGMAFEVVSYGSNLAVNLGANRVAVSADEGKTWTRVAALSPGTRRTDFGTDGTSLFVVYVDSTSSTIERLEGTTWTSARTGLPSRRLQFADGQGTLLAIDGGCTDPCKNATVYKRGSAGWADLSASGRPASLRDPWLAQVASGSLWLLGSMGNDSVAFKLDVTATGSAWATASPPLAGVQNPNLFSFATDGRRIFAESGTSNETYRVDLGVPSPKWTKDPSLANGPRAVGGRLYQAGATKLQRRSDAGAWEDWGEGITCAGSARVQGTALAALGDKLFWATCNGLMKGSGTDPRTKWEKIELGGD